MRILIFCLAMILFFPLVKGQIPVTDVAANASIQSMNLGMQIQSQRKTILDKLQHSEVIAKWVKNIQYAADALKEAKQTKLQIDQMVAMTQQFKAALESVNNVKKLGWGDVNFFTKLLADIDLNPTSYIPRTPQTQGYINDINKAVGGTASSRQVYYAYNSINRFGVFTAKVYDDAVKKSNNNMFYQQQAVALSLEEARGQITTEKITMLNRKIGKNIQDAAKMKEIAADSEVRISEAERITLNEQANALMEQAFNMRLEVTELMTAVNTFTDRPITKSLFDASVHATMSRNLSSVAGGKAYLRNKSAD